MSPIKIDRIRLLRRCAEMAIAGIHREFPCQFPLLLEEPTLFRRPRDWRPAFYGCYDWHSAVHSHWLLVRWLSLGHPEEPGIAEVRSALADNLTSENLTAEYRFLSHPHRTAFERPYGLAWLLQLTSELRNCRDPVAKTWLSGIEPLEQLVVTRFRDGIAMGLPQNDVRRPGLSQLAQDHLAAGIPMLDCNEYAVTHWVGTFAIYALAAYHPSR